MHKYAGKISRKTAQTVSELAIFGAILLFVVGGMVRYAVNYNYNQNQQLAAMRYAFQLSFISGIKNDTSRKSVSVIFIEDRQEATVGRFGGQTRTPYILSGRGMFTNTLFLPQDFAVDNVPVIDFMIDGDHFTFTTAAYKTYNVAYPVDEDGDPVPLVTLTTPVFLGGVEGERDYPIKPCTPDHHEDANCPSNIHYDITYYNGDEVWYPNCYRSMGSVHGCLAFYRQIVNVPSDPDVNFCVSTNCSDDHPWDLPLEDRFNLDLSDTFMFPGGQKCSYNSSKFCDLPDDGSIEITNFPWQWTKTAATTSYVNFGETGIMRLDVDLDGKEEVIMKFTDSKGRLWTPQTGSKSGQAAIIQFQVMDLQEGDWDPTYSDWDRARKEAGSENEARTEDGAYTKNPPGLLGEQRMLTFTNPYGEQGTYLNIQEDASSHKAIQTQKSQRLDIVERLIQLSNDTGHLCRNDYDVDGDGNDHNVTSDVFCISDDITRPRPACGTSNKKCHYYKRQSYPGGCFSTKHNIVWKHCFDADSKILYVRSRILEKRGHRWITDTDQ